MTAERDEYTPTTEQVRLHYATDPEAEYHDPMGYPLTVKANERAFDRWLAEHDREVLDAAKPRVIETADDLDKLGYRAVILDVFGDALVCMRKNLRGTWWKYPTAYGEHTPAFILDLGPVTVLWEGGE